MDRNIKLNINTEFAKCIPPLSKSELSTLEQSLQSEGCRDAIITWNGTIVDGHNRYAICQKHNISFKVSDKVFDSNEKAKIWIIDNQKGRRNLTDGWKFALAQERKRLLLIKGREKRKKTEGRPRKEKLLSIVDASLQTETEQTVSKPTDTKPEDEPSTIVETPKEISTPIVSDKHNTRKEIATDLGWSTGKVAMADKVWKEADEHTKEKIKDGEETFNGVYKKMAKDAQKKRRKEAIKHERKEIDNFKRLKKHALALTEGLEFWADGTMEPETEDEAIAAKIIRAAAPSIITHYSRLGINIPAIYDTFIDPNRRDKNGQQKMLTI
jgi:hypothetical protein